MAAYGTISMGLSAGMPQWVGWIFGGVAALAAITDSYNGKIYNWLTLPALTLGLGFAGFLLGRSGLVWALEAMAIAGLVFIPLFAVGVFGGGDVKLMLALATVLGPWSTFNLICASIMIAGVSAVILLVLRRRTLIFFKELWKFFVSILTPGLEITWPKLDREIKAPFGIAIFLGLLYVFVGGGL